MMGTDTGGALCLPSTRTWRLAGSPTSRSPLSVNATMDGVVRAPSAFSITRGACGREWGMWRPQVPQ
jgi:hypothetical protein